MVVPFPFDAVFFDLDGTLLATDRFWIPAARVGARRAFRELGLERAVPSAQEWTSLIGLPLAEGFLNLFPDLDEASRELVQQRCVEEEHFALNSGLAVLMPGVREVLLELRERGVPMGIASNCSQSYLDAALAEQGLHEYVDEARCLDSAGVRDKAGMIEDLLLTFGVRSAVMVGDRAGDRDAAHANGLPHVHLSNGFAPPGESVECEAVIEDFGGLVPRLEGRTRWIVGALEELGLGSPRGGPTAIGVTGRSGSGKTLFARDLARILESRGRSAVVVALDDFLRADAPARRTGGGEALEPHEHLTLAFDLDRLLEEVLEPHARGAAVSIDRDLPDGRRVSIEVPAGSILILEGLFLLHPRLRPQLKRVLHLEVASDLCLRRIAARELPLGGVEELERARRVFLPAQERFEEAYPPATRADLVLDGENLLGPG